MTSGTGPPSLETPQDYLAAVPAVGRPWLTEFWGYVRRTYPSLELTMFRQTPMFKFDRSYLDGYLMFTAAAGHFAVHAIDFDLVERARTAIPGARGGKGSVAVRYSRREDWPALRDFVDAVMARHGIPRADVGDAPTADEPVRRPAPRNRNTPGDPGPR